jgi:hypothetical protein
VEILGDSLLVPGDFATCGQKEGCRGNLELALLLLAERRREARAGRLTRVALDRDCC